MALRDLEVVSDVKSAAALLHPMRLKLLSLFSEPISATKAAEKAGIPRQIANYHVRELESAGFLELVEENKRGNVTERLLRATAKSYSVGRSVLGALGSDPDKIRDRFSLDYLASLAERAVDEVAALKNREGGIGGRTPSMSVETSVKFRSLEDRSAFARELSNAVSNLRVKYHDERSSDPDTYRFVLIAHPIPSKKENEE